MEPTACCSFWSKTLSTPSPRSGSLPAEESIRAKHSAKPPRELSEETGLVIDPAELGDPVATCRGEWTFRGQPLYSVETFFAWRTDRFEPSTAGWEPLEREVQAAWRWWTIEEINTTNERVLPARLGDVARLITQGTIGPSPIELPWVNFDRIEIDPSPGSTKG